MSPNKKQGRPQREREKRTRGRRHIASAVTRPRRRGGRPADSIISPPAIRDFFLLRRGNLYYFDSASAFCPARIAVQRITIHATLRGSSSARSSCPTARIKTKGPDSGPLVYSRGVLAFFSLFYCTKTDTHLHIIARGGKLYVLDINFQNTIPLVYYLARDFPSIAFN